MKKKIVLCMLMVTVLSFGACKEETPVVTPTATPATKEAASSETATDENKDVEITSDTESTTKKEESKVDGKNGTVNKVICEQENVKITAMNMEDGYSGGKKLKVKIENNSDKDIKIRLQDESINDCTANMYLEKSDIGSGKVANTYISIFGDELKENDIERIDKMEFTYTIKDKDETDYDKYMVDETTVTIPITYN